MTQGASSGEDRAVVNGAGQAVSALRDGIPSAAGRLLRYCFPVLSVIAGAVCLIASTETDGLPMLIWAVAGFVLLFGSIDAAADRARAAEQERWAKLVAKLIGGEEHVVLEIKHSIDSLRPELDEIVKAEVAQAIEALRAEMGPGSVHESAVGETDASDAALLADICDNMAEVLKPLPGIPDAPGQHAGTRATESGEGDKR